MEYQMKSEVRKAKAGEQIAKENILKALKPLLLSSIKKYYFGEEDQEDLLQEGNVRILEAINSFDEHKEIPFLGYVKLQLQYLYMEKRKEKRLCLSLNASVEESESKESFLDLLQDESISIEEDAISREGLSELGKALHALTAKQKRLIELHYFQALNMRQIAKKLGLHYQTVVKNKERAIKQLKINMK